MKKSLTFPLAIAMFAMLAITACAGSLTSESTGEYVDSSALTVKVKAALVEDTGLKSFEIGVETYKDAVQLSGFVDTTALKEKAGMVAAGVSGVRSVKNNIVVK